MDFLFQGFEPQPNFSNREEDTKRDFQFKESVSKCVFNNKCLILYFKIFNILVIQFLKERHFSALINDNTAKRLAFCYLFDVYQESHRKFDRLSIN